MDHRKRGIRSRRAYPWGFLAALLLCPAAFAPGVPAENGAPRDKAAAEAEPGFALYGGFTKGILLRKQEELYLAFLAPRVAGTSPADYQVSLNWGDQNETTSGRLLDAGVGTFAVFGRHTFASTGRYAVNITVTGPDGTTAVASSSVEVGDLYAGALGDWTAATFPASNIAADDFQTTLDWGDGTPAVAGVVSRDGEVFRVRGSHAYAFDGPYTMKVLVTDGAGVRLIRKQPIRVVRPPIAMKVRPIRCNPEEAFTNLEVATFRVPNLLATSREFSVLINWGDGTPLDADGQIVGAWGEFRVLGSHTYAAAGPYRFNVLLFQTWH